MFTKLQSSKNIGLLFFIYVLLKKKGLLKSLQITACSCTNILCWPSCCSDSTIYKIWWVRESFQPQWIHISNTYWVTTSSWTSCRFYVLLLMILFHWNSWVEMSNVCLFYHCISLYSMLLNILRSNKSLTYIVDVVVKLFIL